MRLTARIGLSFIGFFVALFLVMFALRFFFGILDKMSWVSLFYMLLIVIFPALVFVTAFVIFFLRTRRHPSKIVRIISNIIFAAILISWLIYLGIDLKTFFSGRYNSISYYATYNLLFLTINVGTIFIVGIIQALTSEKEQDWTQKHREA